MPTFTRSDIKTSLNGRIHNKSGILASINTTINDALLEVWGVDLRSAKRKYSTALALFDDTYHYACPSDLKGTRIVSLLPQDMNRSVDSEWELVPEDEFDRRKASSSTLISFSDRDFTRRILISSAAETDAVTADSFDSATDFTAFGDAENITTDTVNLIKGSGAVKFDISSAGGTTAGLTKAISTIDLTNYKSLGSVFAWVYITSTTNLTNWKVRIGSSSSDYYEMTATTQSDGTAFQNGWNLLRFDFSGKTTVGTPDDDATDYLAVYMTKTAGKINEDDYRIDDVVVQTGEYFNLIYYSNCPWQSSAGTYKARSTDDTDYINVSEDEWGLVIEKVVERASYEIREYDDASQAAKNYNRLLKAYRKSYPSEALGIQTTYYNI